MIMSDGLTVKALLSMILVCLVAIVSILYQNAPGRYQYSGDGILDTRTGVVKFARPAIVTGIPFEKIPNYFLDDSSYYREVRGIQLQQLKEENDKLEKEARKNGK